MSGSRLYFTLIASLPALPHFDEAERLPINAERLRQRFHLLEPEDAEILDRAFQLVSWRHQPHKRFDAETIALYREMMEVPHLRKIVAFRADVRTILAALRWRHVRGPSPAPASPDDLGPGPIAPHLLRNWRHPDFRLTYTMPWVHPARLKLEAGETFALERQLLDLVWDFLSRFAEGEPFRLDAVLVYLFKWDVVRRWLSYSEEKARTRFSAFVDDLKDSYRHAVVTPLPSTST